MQKPLLSIIIPTLNELTSLPLLLADLAGQQALSFEVIVSDGQSDDGTVALAIEAFADQQIRGQVISGSRGRGRQLNRGARCATGDWLLFLHSDSRLTGERQLIQAIESLDVEQRASGEALVAGRFPLSFSHPEDQNPLAYYFYETKARLGRPGTIHGDQGFLLRTSDFLRIGPFREDLPVMEDTWLAEVVRKEGRWIMLPGEICTSPRRFHSEGFYERQLLNALLMNFLFIDWLDFFREAPQLYRAQPETDRLRLLPFFITVRRLLRPLPFRRRCQLWLATGRYVRSQAWQYGLLRDCRRKLCDQHASGKGPMPWLSWFDRWFEPFTDHCLGHLVTAVLVRFWFSLICRRLQRAELRGG